MVAGRLKEVINILESVVTKNEYGATKTVWTDKIQTKASVEQKTGSRVVVNNEIFNTYTVEFTVWDYHSIKESNRVRWDGNYYLIESIIPDKRKQQLVLVTSLVNE